MSASATRKRPRPPIAAPLPSARATTPRRTGSRASAGRESPDYFGRTEWNTDFAADSMSSATEVFSVFSRGGAISARRSSGGRAVGISAGGVGRSGLSALAGSTGIGRVGRPRLRSGRIDRIGRWRRNHDRRRQRPHRLRGSAGSASRGRAGLSGFRGGSGARTADWVRGVLSPPRSRSMAARARSLASRRSSGAAAASTDGAEAGAATTGAGVAG